MKNSIKLLFLASVFLIACHRAEVLFEDALCIENISIIDPEKGLIDNQTVIIKAGKIHKVVSTDELHLASDNEIIDGTNKFIMPGLWDTHVHFAFVEDLAPKMFDLFIAYGITSVRDIGGEIGFVKKWKERALSSPTVAPRVMIAGPLLDGIPNVYDGSVVGRPPISVGLHNVDDVIKQVNQLDSLGVDLLKAYEMLAPDQFVAITRLGQEKGLKVTGHVPLSMDVISASNAGLNSIEHLKNLEMSCASNADDLLKERREMLVLGKNEPGGVLRSRIHRAIIPIALDNYDESKAQEVLDVLAKNQTWQIPTLTINVGATKRFFASEEWKESYKYLPDSIEKQWIDNVDQMMSEEPSEFSRKFANWKLKIVDKIHQAGIEMMAGTDTPVGYLTPGLSLHQELALLVEAGLSPLDAIKTATLNPARYFNLENELGSIQENMWADLVLLDANPLENIMNTKCIYAVLKQGKYFDRKELDEILERLINQ
ncbi:MAG: amidohydrolase family protein [Aurantibacter sp.]